MGTGLPGGGAPVFAGTAAADVAALAEALATAFAEGVGSVAVSAVADGTTGAAGALTCGGAAEGRASLVMDSLLLGSLLLHAASATRAAPRVSRVSRSKRWRTMIRRYTRSGGACQQ
jgi:hypothetical protein